MNKQTLCRCIGSAVIVAVIIGGAASVSRPSAQTARRSVQSPPPPLMIGGKNFRIGMTRQEAMALVAECCRTQGEPEEGMFLFQKTGDFIILGSISFKGGRVSRLVRDEKQVTAKDASDFVLAFYRGILNGQTTSQDIVNISAFPDELSNGINRYILLTYRDGRKLRITQYTVDSGEVGVQLEEER